MIDLRVPADRERLVVWGLEVQLDQVLDEPSVLRDPVVEAPRGLVARLRVPVDPRAVPFLGHCPTLAISARATPQAASAGTLGK
jgi:hypothetical protein